MRWALIPLIVAGFGAPVHAAPGKGARATFEISHAIADVDDVRLQPHARLQLSGKFQIWYLMGEPAVGCSAIWKNPGISQVVFDDGTRVLAQPGEEDLYNLLLVAQFPDPDKSAKRFTNGFGAHLSVFCDAGEVAQSGRSGFNVAGSPNWGEFLCATPSKLDLSRMNAIDRDQRDPCRSVGGAWLTREEARKVAAQSFTIAEVMVHGFEINNGDTVRRAEKMQWRKTSQARKQTKLTELALRLGELGKDGQIASQRIVAGRSALDRKSGGPSADDLKSYDALIEEGVAELERLKSQSLAELKKRWQADDETMVSQQLERVAELDSRLAEEQAARIDYHKELESRAEHAPEPPPPVEQRVNSRVASAPKAPPPPAAPPPLPEALPAWLDSALAAIERAQSGCGSLPSDATQPRSLSGGTRADADATKATNERIKAWVECRRSELDRWHAERTAAHDRYRAGEGRREADERFQALAERETAGRDEAGALVRTYNANVAQVNALYQEIAANPPPRRRASDYGRYDGERSRRRNASNDGCSCGDAQRGLCGSVAEDCMSDREYAQRRQSDRLSEYALQRTQPSRSSVRSPVLSATEQRPEPAPATRRVTVNLFYLGVWGQHRDSSVACSAGSSFFANEVSSRCECEAVNVLVKRHVLDCGDGIYIGEKPESKPCVRPPDDYEVQQRCHRVVTADLEVTSAERYLAEEAEGRNRALEAASRGEPPPRRGVSQGTVVR